jgi:hypothetical protein
MVAPLLKRSLIVLMFRVPDVVIRLERLGPETPESGGGFRIFFISHDDIQFDQNGHPCGRLCRPIWHPRGGMCCRTAKVQTPKISRDRNEFPADYPLHRANRLRARSHMGTLTIPWQSDRFLRSDRGGDGVGTRQSSGNIQQAALRPHQGTAHP